jgi:TonB family protein
MRSPILFCVFALPVLIFLDARAAPSDWLSAPRPNFPPSALGKGSEGPVRLKLFFGNEGSVTSARVLKTSGDTVLDETARSAVLKWKLKPSAIKPSDLTKGRIEEIEFRQEAMMGAKYPGFSARFTNDQVWKPWTFAPFPNYSVDARLRGHEGTVVLRATIAVDGTVVAVQIAKSSGHSDLDDSGVNAVRHWRAHRQYAGQELLVPIGFSRTRSR